MRSNRKMQRVLSVFVCLLAMVLMLSSCGQTATTAGPSAGTDNTATTGSSSASGEPVTVVMAAAEAINTLDPCNGFAMTFNRLLPLWASTLLESDHLGNYTPSVATDIKWADDGMSLTATIKEGIKFQDGSELTAKDVAFTYTRIITDPDLLNPKIWKKFLKSCELGSAPNTVDFTFNMPMPNFNSECTFVPIISQAAYEASGKGASYFSETPMGSGPYKVTSFDTTNCIVTFEKWPDSWEWTKGSGNVDKIIYKSIPESTTRASSLQTGEIDIDEGITLESVATLEGAGCTIHRVPYYQNNFIMFNFKENSLWNDAKIRQALSEAIDRTTLVETVVGGGFAATWPMMEGCEGYMDNPNGYPYDPEHAKQLLSESSYDGREVTMNICPAFIPKAAEIAQAIQAMAVDAGFNFKVNLLEQAAHMDAMFSGKYDLLYGSFVYQNGMPFKFYTEILSSTMDVFKNGYSNEAINAAFAKGAGTVDKAEREGYWLDGLQEVMDNYAPAVFVFNEEWADATTANISGYKLFNDSVIDIRFLTKK